jgi:hypothetical protein
MRDENDGGEAPQKRPGRPWTGIDPPKGGIARLRGMAQPAQGMSASGQIRRIGLWPVGKGKLEFLRRDEAKSGGTISEGKRDRSYRGSDER